MNLVLLLPAALVALAALALPLLLHLARRQQQLPTVFAALRWLRTKPRPRRRIRFDERWLLLARLLLLALLALLLARPALQGIDDRRPRLLVMPGVPADAIAAVRGQHGPDARWLATGFPPLDAPQPDASQPGASLLREFDASLAAGAALTVLVPEQFAAADGARLQLTRQVDWRIAPSPATAQDTPEPAVPVLEIRDDAAHRAGARYLRAAARAWQEAATTPAAVTHADAGTDASPPADTTTVLAWLRAEPLPASLLAWVERGGTALVPAGSTQPWPESDHVAWRASDGAALLRRAPLGAGRVLRLERALAPQAMPQLLDPDFPARLREVLQPPAPPRLVAAADYAPASGARATPLAPRDLSAWLALAIALLALLERWLATSPRRRLPA